MIEDSMQQTVGIIEWRKHPVIEISGVVPKTSSAHFLPLSPDRSHRLMAVRGVNYKWMPDAHHISLYNASPISPQFYGKLSQSRDGSIAFEITVEALEQGLLEVFVVSALLLMCGRNID
ncbi:hypothetical protein R3P38DRAFT_2867347 [Favolaschia claudopus]|uniref:Uncharacterized protein n=1 Tax=Favolaschia claudopus TaxID=2862362 RepID=A0AAW0DAF8_9AGAR